MADAPRSKLRVMVNTNVLLSGVVWPRWPYEILKYARARREYCFTISDKSLAIGGSMLEAMMSSLSNTRNS